MDGSDYKASLYPQEFKDLVDAIRNVDVAMGDGVRKFSENELEIKKIARKSIVLNEKLSKGTIIKREMLSIKRPGTGIAPKYIEELVGRKLNQDFDCDTVLQWNYLK